MSQYSYIDIANHSFLNWTQFNEISKSLNVSTYEGKNRQWATFECNWRQGNSSPQKIVKTCSSQKSCLNSNIICAVCGIQTYSKRIRAISLEEFPFIKAERKQGSIIIGNFQFAIVCLDCYESLRVQNEEFNKMGVPTHFRQFNWMRRPPPPANSIDSVIGRLPCGRKVVSKNQNFDRLKVELNLLDQQEIMEVRDHHLMKNGIQINFPYKASNDIEMQEGSSWPKSKEDLDYASKSSIHREEKFGPTSTSSHNSANCSFGHLKYIAKTWMDKKEKECTRKNRESIQIQKNILSKQMREHKTFKSNHKCFNTWGSSDSMDRKIPKFIKKHLSLPVVRKNIPSSLEYMTAKSVNLSQTNQMCMSKCTSGLKNQIALHPTNNLADSQIECRTLNKFQQKDFETLKSAPEISYSSDLLNTITQGYSVWRPSVIRFARKN